MSLQRVDFGEALRSSARNDAWPIGLANEFFDSCLDLAAKYIVVARKV